MPVVPHSFGRGLRNLVPAALVFLTCLAGAAEPRSNAAGPPVPPSLSRSELRACMVREQELDDRQDASRKAHDVHDADLAESSAEAKVLSSLLRSLDPSDEAAVQAYNQRNDARNARVDKLNKRAAELNAQGQQFRNDSADYLKECVARPYLKSDKEALLREKGKAPAKPKARPDAPESGRDLQS